MKENRIKNFLYEFVKYHYKEEEYGYQNSIINNFDFSFLESLGKIDFQPVYAFSFDDIEDYYERETKRVNSNELFKGFFITDESINYYCLDPYSVSQNIEFWINEDFQPFFVKSYESDLGFGEGLVNTRYREILPVEDIAKYSEFEIGTIGLLEAIKDMLSDCVL